MVIAEHDALDVDASQDRLRFRNTAVDCRTGRFGRCLLGHCAPSRPILGGPASRRWGVVFSRGAGTALVHCTPPVAAREDRPYEPAAWTRTSGSISPIERSPAIAMLRSRSASRPRRTAVAPAPPPPAGPPNPGPPTSTAPAPRARALIMSAPV